MVVSNQSNRPHRQSFPNLLSGLRRAKGPIRWVGVDLGSASIKIAELEKEGESVRLIKQLIQELPALEARPVDRKGWLQSAFKEFDISSVHLVANGPEVVIRRVFVPPMSARELSEAVKWQVKDELPFPIQEAILDFQVLGDVWEKDIKKQDVLVAAAAKTIIDRLIETVQRAGGHVASIVPAPVALWSCVGSLVPEANEGSVAIIELGANTTRVAIVKNGNIRVAREIAIGSATVTEALVGETSSDQGRIIIDEPKAEALKRHYGILAEAPEGTSEEGVPLFHIASLMRPVLENLLTEVSRFFDFYKVQMDEEGILRAFLCGGGANLKQIQPFLAEGLGLTVEVFNPLMRIPDRVQAIEPEGIAELGPRLAVAAGVALNHGKDINLLSDEAGTGKSPAVSRQAWIRIAQAAAGIALIVFAALKVTAVLLDRELRQEQAAWAQVKSVYTQALGAIASHKALEGSLNQIEGFLDQQPVWEGIFKELGELIPPGIELEELHVAKKEAPTVSEALRITLQGHVILGDSASKASVSEFIESLEESVFFSDVTLVSSELRAGTAGATKFEIECELE